MAEACGTWDTLVSSSVVVKCMPGRAQPPLKFAMHCHLVCKGSRYSNRTVKYSIKTLSNYVNYIYVVTPTLWYYHWHNNEKGIIGSAMGIK